MRARTKLFAILAVILTISASFYAGTVLASPAPSINSTCEPGGCTINAYCTEQVYIDSSGPTYLYRDRTGINQQQGTNASVIIQAALNVIQNSNSPSGRVCLDYGSFPLGGGGLVINNHGVQLVGSGADFAGTRETVLTYTGSGDAIKVYSAAIRLQRTYLADFNIQATGAATSSTTAIGLELNTVEEATVERVTIRDFSSGTGLKADVDVSAPARYTANTQIYNSAFLNNKFGVQTIGIDATHKVNTLAFFSDTNIGTTVAGGIGYNFDQFTDAPLFVLGDLESYDTQYKIAGTNGNWYETRTEVTGTTVFVFTATSSKNIVFSHLFVGGGTAVTDSGTSNIVMLSQGYNPNGFSMFGGAITYCMPSDPAGTTSVGGVMAGLACSFTPKFSGRAFLSVTMKGSGSASQVTPTVQIRYGTGTAPLNGVALTGTTVGTTALATSANAGDKNTIAVSAIITSGLVPGTAYWFDLSEATNAGTSTLFTINYVIIEI